MRPYTETVLRHCYIRELSCVHRSNVLKKSNDQTVFCYDRLYANDTMRVLLINKLLFI